MTEGQASVFVVEDGKAEQRHITVGLTNDGLVEITTGLKGQEQVVVVGQGGLKSGNAVRVVELESPHFTALRAQPRCRRAPAVYGAITMQLVDFATRRRVTIVMCMVAIALFGFVSLARLKVNLLPDLSYPTLTVRTELVGAAPLEIENLITRPVEEAVGIIECPPGALGITFRPVGRDAGVRLGHGHGSSGHRGTRKTGPPATPLEAKRPLLLRFDPSTEPVLRFALLERLKPTARFLSTPKNGCKFLRRFAEDRLKPDLEAVPGSAAVKVSGGYEDEIQVFVDQQKLAQLGLSIETVASRLRAENVNLSGGRLEQGTQRFLVRTLNEFQSIEEMSGAIIAAVDGQPVYLRDVATVTTATRNVRRSRG